MSNNHNVINIKSIPAHTSVRALGEFKPALPNIYDQENPAAYIPPTHMLDAGIAGSERPDPTRADAFVKATAKRVHAAKDILASTYEHAADNARFSARQLLAIGAIAVSVIGVTEGSKLIWPPRETVLIHVQQTDGSISDVVSRVNPEASAGQVNAEAQRIINEETGSEYIIKGEELEIQKIK
jgi:hypothetical protein